MSKAASAAETDRRSARHAAAREHRRGIILDAARRVFANKGLDGASIREIAEAAGYTPGALYFTYAGKEEIYGDVLASSLADLAHTVKDAAHAAPDVDSRLRAGPLAFFDYYRDHPIELDLSFYLVRGIQPRGLTPEINRQLNGRLIALLQVMADAIAAYDGVTLEAANQEAVAAATHMCGLLLMEKSGRLGTLGFEARAMAETYLDQLAARLA